MSREDSSSVVALNTSVPVGELPLPLVAAAQHMFGEHLNLARRYATILATMGVDYGLLGPREAPRVWDRHILNCVAVTELIPLDQKVIDVGSGAGLPGVALAITRPDLYMTLFEPLLRRHTFLQHVLHELALGNIQNIRRRLGVGPVNISAHIVTARAVAPLERLVPWCFPLLRRGGRLLAIKGESAADELKSSEATLREHRVAAARVVRCGEGVLDSPAFVIELTKP